MEKKKLEKSNYVFSSISVSAGVDFLGLKFLQSKTEKKKKPHVAKLQIGILVCRLINSSLHVCY